MWCELKVLGKRTVAIYKRTVAMNAITLSRLADWSPLDSEATTHSGSENHTRCGGRLTSVYSTNAHANIDMRLKVLGHADKPRPAPTELLSILWRADLRSSS